MVYLPESVFTYFAFNIDQSGVGVFNQERISSLFHCVFVYLSLKLWRVFEIVRH